MFFSSDLLHTIIKNIPQIIGGITIVTFVYKILKRLYELNTNVEKVLYQQIGQMSMHERLQDALNEIKGIKLVCNERHKWDKKTERRNK
jgi:inhibitor of KinA sporulation pathway (predicted exonuclease)